MTSTCNFLLSACDTIRLLFQKQTAIQLFLKTVLMHLSLPQHFCWGNWVSFRGNQWSKLMSELSWQYFCEDDCFQRPSMEPAAKNEAFMMAGRLIRSPVPLSPPVLPVPHCARGWDCSPGTQLVNIQLPASYGLPLYSCLAMPWEKWQSMVETPLASSSCISSPPHFVVPYLLSHIPLAVIWCSSYYLASRFSESQNWRFIGLEWTSGNHWVQPPAKAGCLQ